MLIRLLILPSLLFFYSNSSGTLSSSLESKTEHFERYVKVFHEHLLDFSQPRCRLEITKGGKERQQLK